MTSPSRWMQCPHVSGSITRSSRMIVGPSRTRAAGGRASRAQWLPHIVSEVTSSQAGEPGTSKDSGRRAFFSGATWFIVADS